MLPAVLSERKRRTKMNARLSTPMNSRIPSQNLAHQAKTKRMVQLALMISIIFVMAFSPLGYLRTPGLTITFLTVPVAVGAVLMGPLAGAVCGLAFGITSLITAMTGGSPFSSMLLSINPLALAFTCMVPRVLEGWLCGLIFAALRPRFKNASYFIACLACPLLNTVLFMSSLILFFYNTDYVQGLAASLGASNPLIFVILFVGIQGAIEAAACTVLGSAVSRTLAAALKR
jgi:uncharacterized membrane protein